MLGDFNWRTRLTGAYFAAINNYQQFTDAIGRLLLKSEVCYAADGYCLALLLFGTAEAKDYLQQYLHYYLRRPDLWFDQNDALAALTLLDTAAAAEFAEAWLKFVADKPNWNLQRTTEQLQACAAVIRRMRLDLGH
ncbi:hypothetical protein DLM85_22200 [Hymenobacter edaphi]|uniref:Uncharacterized protein n=1 Tax=Hymenobacter edaphi TaxID=2211146 RepID=A0A328BB21_9BACT|nr:hypothetical protein DLM85_22200 [Hymenobacter edaphi]